MQLLPKIAESSPNGPRSQTTWAYEALRRDIIAGRHSPGVKLNIQDLALELKVSPGAVREALSRLVPEQLTVSQHQRGFLVAPLSLADLKDLTELRCEIEANALRRSVARGDINWEAQLVAAGHLLGATHQPKPGSGEVITEWVTNHAGFHTALVSACGSPRLLGLHAQLYEQSERYRLLSAYVEPQRDITGEHRQILELALARDANGLEAAVIEHIQRTTALIIAATRDGTFADS